MEQPKKKVLLTPKRVNEIADSLSESGNRNLKTGTSQKKYIGKPVDSLLKTKWGELAKKGSYSTDEKGNLMDSKIWGTTADEKIESGKKDLENAARYRKLAEAAKRAKINR